MTQYSLVSTSIWTTRRIVRTTPPRLSYGQLQPCHIKSPNLEQTPLRPLQNLEDLVLKFALHHQMDPSYKPCHILPSENLLFSFSWGESLPQVCAICNEHLDVVRGQQKGQCREMQSWTRRTGSIYMQVLYMGLDT